MNCPSNFSISLSAGVFAISTRGASQTSVTKDFLGFTEDFFLQIFKDFLEILGHFELFKYGHIGERTILLCNSL